jgi:hypothetical protein
VSLELPRSPSAFRPKSVEIGKVFFFFKLQLSLVFRYEGVVKHAPPPIDATCKMRTLNYVLTLGFFFFF